MDHPVPDSCLTESRSSVIWLSRRLCSFLAKVASVALCVAAFLRGNYLLGPSCGVTYAAISVGLLWLLVGSRTPVRGAAVAVLSLAAGGMMAFPASINPSMQYFIDKQAADRVARTELAAVFGSDPAFRELSTSSVQLKVVNVTIRGSLDTRSDLNRLRSRIAAECPTLGGCFLHWDLIFRDSGQRLSGLDRNLFQEAERS